MTNCGCHSNSSGFVIVIVLYILLAIILGSAMTC
ncbi:MAG: YjcZ family sporulation protein [Bacilli bacterium]